MEKIFEIINEELNDFDFLGVEERVRNEDNIEFLRKEEFQKQYIIDTLLNPDKINVETLESSIDEIEGESRNRYNFKHKPRIKYTYDSEKQPMEFQLEIVGSGKIDEEFSDNFDINLLSTSGEVLEFKAFNKAPKKIKSLFIRENIHELISEVESSEAKDKNIVYH